MPISSSIIAKTEELMGVTFPMDFKLHMMKRNGGQVMLDDEPWWLFPFYDPTDRRTIRRTADDIKRATKTAIADDLGFPNDGVAIAHNGAGDLLLLRGRDGKLQADVWIFRLRGELVHTMDKVQSLWER